MRPLKTVAACAVYLGLGAYLLATKFVEEVKYAIAAREEHPDDDSHEPDHDESHP